MLEEFSGYKTYCYNNTEIIDIQLSYNTTNTVNSHAVCVIDSFFLVEQGKCILGLFKCGNTYWPSSHSLTLALEHCI